MALNNSETTWGTVSKVLHWAMAIVIIVAIALALYADTLDPDIAADRALWWKLMIETHKPLGFVAMVLIVIRVIWALKNTRPQMPSSMKFWELKTSKVIHITLYGLMIFVPYSGYIMSQYAGGSPIDFFGLFKVPNFIGKDEEAVKIAHWLHVNIGLFLGAIVLFHVFAALFHHFVRKDNVLKAMLPFSKAKTDE